MLADRSAISIANSETGHEAVRQRAIAAARQRSSQPATPALDPVFVALNLGALPARERSSAALYEWVRREEQ